MAPNVRLIIGLGNPGERYRNTWHNLGARTVELLARQAGATLNLTRGQLMGAEASVAGERVMLMIPATFMNLSGGPVGNWIRYNKIALEDLLVVYDDHDLPLGKLRLRDEGSSGGHRGMEDIVRSLGTDAFPRLKIGIRTDREHANLADQVLTPIPKSLEGTVERVLVGAAEAVGAVVKEGILATANKYNGLDFG